MATCPYCGRDFFQVKENHIFCSVKCGTAHDYQLNKEKYESIRRSKRPVYDKQCKECGQPYQTTNNVKIFCSNECKIKNNNSLRPRSCHEIRECPVCKKIFKPMQKSGTGRKYCTIKCRQAAWSVRSRVISREANFKNKIKTKWNGNWYKALQRDDFTCQVCGRKKTPYDKTTARRYILEVHHRDGSGEKESKNHSLDNLMTLCAECHREFHTKVNLIFKDGEYYISGKVFDILGLQTVKTTV